MIYGIYNQRVDLVIQVKERTSGFETVTTVANATVHGDLGKLVGSMAKQKAKDMLGIKYKRK